MWRDNWLEVMSKALAQLYEVEWPEMISIIQGRYFKTQKEVESLREITVWEFCLPWFCFYLVQSAIQGSQPPEDTILKIFSYF